MSTSVYKPICAIPKTVDRGRLARFGIQKVKRVLFEPANPETTEIFLKEELNRITVNDSERWNFDFKNEKPLNPNGILKWEAVAPQKLNRPVKRIVQHNDVDIYQFYPSPADVIRPIPVKPNDGNDKNKAHTQSQMLITDFMSVKKRPLNALSEEKKADWNAERPAKIPKLADLS